MDGKPCTEEKENKGLGGSKSQPVASETYTKTFTYDIIVRLQVGSQTSARPEHEESSKVLFLPLFKPSHCC